MRQKLTIIVTMLMMFFLASTVSASIPGDISTSKYIKAYVRGTQNVAAYRDSSLSIRGNSNRAYNAAVYPSDEIKIYQMNASVAKIGYIAGSSWVTAYIPTSAITLNNASRDRQQFTSSVGQGSVYARPNGTVYSGSAIDRGDYVWKLAEENGYSQVVYPAGSVYKMAWIRTTDYNSRIDSGRVVPTPTPNTIVQPVVRDTYASIAEGDYYLIPEANSNYALDVKGGGAAPAETPLWLYNKNGSDAQIFHIKRVSGDWYIIQHKRTGLVANVQWGNANSGTGIWLYHNDGTASCYWRFIKQSNGSYMIQSMLNSNPIMELQNNSVYTGGRIQLWARHDGQAGKWRLEKVQNNGFQQYSKTAARQVKAYATSSLSSVYGNEWVDKGDVVTVLEETSNAYKVRYPVSNGYKERWVSKDIFTSEPIPTPTNVTYAAYTGVNYKNMGLSQERINCLNKAVKLATVQWTSPTTFRTWQASSGGYNTVKAVDGTASQYFISGKTYTGIPYSMNDHTYDDISWANLAKKGFSQSYMECRYNGRSCTTAHGIDCSYLVYLCFKAAGTNKSISYQTTSTMLNSSYYSKKSLNQIKGGDIFLKNGHVMLYVGRSGSGYAVIEANASDSRVKYNVYSSSKLSSYSVYKFNGFYD